MEKLEKIIRSTRFEFTIIVLILINAVTLGLETNKQIVAEYGELLYAIDRTLLTIFTIELAARALVFRERFFHDPWRIFDLIVVSVSWIPTTGSLSVLRALRILRVFRLISMVPSLRRVVGGLVAALPGMGSIIVLLALVFYVFSVMATKLFGDQFPQWFGSIGASAYSLFQIMTLESWSMGIVRPVMEAYPFAWLFFIPFILATTFTVLNLFIGIIVSAMQSEHEEMAAADRQELHNDQTAILDELKALRKEVAAMRGEPLRTRD